MAKEQWIWLASALGWGAANTKQVLQAYPGGPQEVANALGSPELNAILTQKQAARLAQSCPGDFAPDILRMQGQGIQVLPYDDAQYPQALRDIPNPPPVLFVQGDISLLNGRLSIGMVGARRPSAYGVEAVKMLGRGVALGGAVIVSGMAAGLDTEAHKAALAVNAPTIACVAFGHDQCYPAANRKLMEVIARTGAVVSEYPLGIKPEKAFFLQRNRLIAGMVHGLVVIEARRRSGTMSTVDFATDFGRDVFAVPGSIFSELSGGTNAMIREGAYVASGAEDILSVYGVELPEGDLAQAAAFQAAAGRPAMAAAAPPWPTNTSRVLAAEKKAFAEKTAKLQRLDVQEVASSASFGVRSKPAFSREVPPAAPRRETLAQNTSTLSGIAQRVLAQLGPVPTGLNDICEKSGLSSAQAMAALTELELAGASRQLAGRQFVAI